MAKFNKNCENTTKIQKISCISACLHGGGGPQVGEVTCGGSPYLSCKHDQIKRRDYMDRRITAPKRVTSPTWAPKSQGLLRFYLHLAKDLLKINLCASFQLHSVLCFENIALSNFPSLLRAVTLSVNLRDKTGEERRRQTLCDKRDNNFV